MSKPDLKIVQNAKTPTDAELLELAQQYIKEKVRAELQGRVTPEQFLLAKRPLLEQRFAQIEADRQAKIEAENLRESEEAMNILDEALRADLGQKFQPIQGDLKAAIAEAAVRVEQSPEPKKSISKSLSTPLTMAQTAALEEYGDKLPEIVQESSTHAVAFRGVICGAIGYVVDRICYEENLPRDKKSEEYLIFLSSKKVELIELTKVLEIFLKNYYNINEQKVKSARAPSDIYQPVKDGVFAHPRFSSLLNVPRRIEWEDEQISISQPSSVSSAQSRKERDAKRAAKQAADRERTQATKGPSHGVSKHKKGKKN